jgi:hypothetical protein
LAVLGPLDVRVNVEVFSVPLVVVAERYRRQDRAAVGNPEPALESRARVHRRRLAAEDVDAAVRDAQRQVIQQADFAARHERFDADAGGILAAQPRPRGGVVNNPRFTFGDEIALGPRGESSDGRKRENEGHAAPPAVASGILWLHN